MRRWQGRALVVVLVTGCGDSSDDGGEATSTVASASASASTVGGEGSGADDSGGGTGDGSGTSGQDSSGGGDPVACALGTDDPLWFTIFGGDWEYAVQDVVGPDGAPMMVWSLQADCQVVGVTPISPGSFDVDLDCVSATSTGAFRINISGADPAPPAVAAGQSIALEHRYTAAMVNERFVLRDDSGAMLAAQTRGTEVLASDAELSALLAPLSLARAPAACVPDPDPIACCPACPQPPCCPAGDETGTFTLRPVPIDLALDGQTLRLLSRQRGPLSTYDAFLAESATVDTSSCASAFPDDLRLTVIAT